MNKKIRTLMIALLAAGSACTSQAEGEDSKIKVKITKEVDGKKQTFEREYKSAEEMRADEECREFVRVGMNGLHETMIELHLDDDEFFPRKYMKSFQFHGNGQNRYWFGDDAGGDTKVLDLRMFGSEDYEEELEEKMAELEKKLKGLDKSLREDIMESIEEIQEISSGVFPRRINRSGISIEDAGDDFGKRGKVEEKNKLDADDMNFMIMGSRLTLRFRVKEAGELTVAISNEEGKEIYNRYFEKFGGMFSDHIDFSKYSDGKYLLEITQDKKRLTKKIVID